MFFQQAFKGENNWWRYLSVTILVFLGYQIGSLPLILALWRTRDNEPNIDQSDIEGFFSNPDFINFGINRNLGLTLMLLMFVAALVVFYFVFRPFHSREFRSLSTPSSTINWNKIFFAFFLWLGLSLLLEGALYFVDPSNYFLDFKLNTFIPLLILGIFVLPLQTSFEELFFRGYLMQGLGVMHRKAIYALILGFAIVFGLQFILGAQLNDLFSSVNTSASGVLTNLTYLLAFALIFLALQSLFKNKVSTEPHNNKVFPLIITSILFGLIHSSNPEIEKFGFFTMQAYYMSAGLLLGIMTVMDDGLELALGTHAATNFVGAIFVGYDGAAINTDSIFKTNDLNPHLMLIGFIVLAIVFLIILKNKYKWPSFTKIFDPIFKPDEDLALQQYISETET